MVAGARPACHPFRQLHVRECASRRIPIPLIIKAKVLNPQFALIRAPNGRSAGVRKGSQDRATVIPHRNPDWARRRRQRSIWLAGGASIRAVLTALYSRMSAFLRRASGSSRPNCSPGTWRVLAGSVGQRNFPPIDSSPRARHGADDERASRSPYARPELLMGSVCARRGGRLRPDRYKDRQCGANRRADQQMLHGVSSLWSRPSTWLRPSFFQIIFVKRNHNYENYWSGVRVPSRRGRSCR